MRCSLISLFGPMITGHVCVVVFVFLHIAHCKTRMRELNSDGSMKDHSVLLREKGLCWGARSKEI